jgi:hypothetical protein
VVEVSVVVSVVVVVVLVVAVVLDVAVVVSVTLLVASPEALPSVGTIVVGVVAEVVGLVEVEVVVVSSEVVPVPVSLAAEVAVGSLLQPSEMQATRVKNPRVFTRSSSEKQSPDIRAAASLSSWRPPRRRPWSSFSRAPLVLHESAECRVSGGRHRHVSRDIHARAAARGVAPRLSAARAPVLCRSDARCPRPWIHRRLQQHRRRGRPFAAG